MGAPELRIRRVVIALASSALVMAGCTAGQGPRPSSEPRSPMPTGSVTSPSPSPAESSPIQLIAFGSYLEHKGDFEATRIVALDPATFRPIRGEQLQLGDSVTTRLVDPRRRLIALGGVNFGQVILVDPAKLSIEAKVKVAHRPPFSPEVELVSWPTSHRIIGYTQQSGAHELFPGRVFLLDPEQQHVLKSVPLRGSVVAAVATSRGAAFLVSPVRMVGPTRLVTMDARGRIRTIRLDQLIAGFVDPGTAGDSIERTPALVSFANVVDVIGAAEPVASVRVHSARVTYHSIPGLMAAHLRASTSPADGSAGALETLDRQASSVGATHVLVTGYEAYPVHGGADLRSFERTAQIVDLGRWRVLRTLQGLSDVQLAGPILMGRSVNGRLTALSRKGTVLYQLPGRNRSWAVVGNHLFEAHLDGSRVLELNIRTGQEIRGLGSLPPGDLWPLDALFWPPNTREASAGVMIGG